MKVAVLIDDMFFGAKVSETARFLRTEVVFCRSAETAPLDAERICVDLNASGFDAVEAIRALKATHSAPVIAYVSHVQSQLKERAQAAGADQVIARSTFIQKLPEILSASGQPFSQAALKRAGD